MTNKFAIRILVLDEESSMCKLLGRMLDNSGFTSVITCDSGRAALVLLDRTYLHPDLIMLDINMPEIDGVEFVRQLVEHHYSGSLILLSGEDGRALHSVEKLLRAHDITLLGYLTKPVKPERLGALIDKWVRPAQEAIKATKTVNVSTDCRGLIASGELANLQQLSHVARDA